MSRLLNAELTAKGAADVIVVLRSKAAPLRGASRAEDEGDGAAAARGRGGAGRRLGIAARTVSAESALPDLFKLLRPAGEHTQLNALAATARKPRAAAAPLYFRNLGVVLGSITADQLPKVKAHAAVRKVLGVPSLSLIRPVQHAAAAQPATTWGLKAMGAPDLWKQGVTGKGVLVGHLDTGADGKHPALAGAIGRFAFFDDLGRQSNTPGGAFDTDEHGTHTAATIAGRPVQGTTRVGVAPDAQLAVGVVIEGGHVVARILGGLDWVIGQRCRVLSMSLGLRGYVDDFYDLMRLVREGGVLPVIAAGNEGPGTSRSPGNYDDVVSVGAYGKNARVADFSSSDEFDRAVDPVVPDLVGPGVDVVSAKPQGGYQSMSGTSMATPHVAGLAALLFGAAPSATVDQVEKAIFDACRPLPGMDAHRGGRGAPNARRALAALVSKIRPAARAAGRPGAEAML